MQSPFLIVLENPFENRGKARVSRTKAPQGSHGPGSTPDPHLLAVSPLRVPRRRVPTRGPCLSRGPVPSTRGAAWLAPKGVLAERILECRPPLQPPRGIRACVPTKPWPTMPSCVFWVTLTASGQLLEAAGRPRSPRRPRPHTLVGSAGLLMAQWAPEAPQRASGVHGPCPAWGMSLLLQVLGGSSRWSCGTFLCSWAPIGVPPLLCHSSPAHLNMRFKN